MGNDVEIGSEFAIGRESAQTGDARKCALDFFDFLGKSVFVLSGRTAIDLICRDILAAGGARNVYMPAYCCASMVEPFVRHGVEVEFYDVGFDGKRLDFKIDRDKNVGILYLANYFGYRSPMDMEWVKRKKKEGAVVVYDKTHSLFLPHDGWLGVADYAFCSLRKWFAVASGAVLSRRKGDFTGLELRECGYVDEKLEAQRLKWRYLEGDPSVRKEMFYPRFADFDRRLRADYADYKMDDVSLRLLEATDLDAVRHRRRRNALFLYEKLRGADGLEFMFDNLEEDVAPLFVPALTQSAKLRTGLKERLIERRVYCPSHWPKNEWTTSGMEVNGIVDREISLVCDQRYTPAQLDRLVQTILNK